MQMTYETCKLVWNSSRMFMVHLHHAWAAWNFSFRTSRRTSQAEMRLDRTEKAREMAASSPPPSGESLQAAPSMPPGILPPPAGASNLTAHLAIGAPVYQEEGDANTNNTLPQGMPSQHGSLELNRDGAEECESITFSTPAPTPRRSRAPSPSRPSSDREPDPEEPLWGRNVLQWQQQLRGLT